MSSPLFRNAARALEQAAQREATVRQLTTVLKSVGGTRSVMRNARQLMRETEGLPEVQRYGRVSDFVRQQIIDEVIRQLGPLGAVVSALIRPQGRMLTDDIAQEVDAAAQILQEIVGPPDRPEWMRPRESTGGVSGGRTPPSAPAPASPTPDPGGRIERQVIGRRYTFEPDDPIVTGEMIDVISSNVHSIGYVWNDSNPSQGTLLVRFLESGGRKSAQRGAGPLYEYFNVHPEVFMAFQLAASKGRFVWDRLRVRGTVSGHRYQYDLADTGATNYVPRKATRLGPSEYFLRREYANRQTGVTSQSQLEDEFVRRIGINRNGPQGFVPNRGAPNRGGPNRGR